MKKKGLIIATIVMVLVLSVSLTTATYAWFSNTASTTVDTINVNIASLSDVEIGVTTSAKYPSTTATDYYNGAINFNSTGNAVVFAAEDAGSPTLGTELVLGSPNLSTAIATVDNSGEGFDLEEATTVDSTFTPSHLIFEAPRAAGGDNASTTPGTPNFANASEAIANVDYIDLPMGARAAKKDTVGIYATIKVKTTDSAEVFKMNAALRFYIMVGSTKVFIDTFGNAKFDTSKSSYASLTPTTTGVTYENVSGQVQASFSFLIAGTKTVSEFGSAESLYSATGSPIQTFRIYAFVYGPDDACVTNAAGCQCAIDISFHALYKDSTSSDVPTNFVTLAA